uniref:Uncharacterized protein n=1 Tax=Ananas comosus var. bracteatus TaxID=296719 RepID=A0A6V7Q9D2_ANACO|nr:unnamed protein product [Ananas comosus var. bracteatus]
MNSPDRAKKKSPAPAIAVAASSNLWKKALLHFSLCFATGFFSGLAPFSSSSSSQSLLRYLARNSTQFPQSPIQTPKFPLHNRTLTEEANAYVDADPPKPLSPPPPPRPLLIIVTAASASASAVRSAAALTRLGHTLRLVPPPLLWIVAGPRDGAAAAAAAAAVRRMGVMQRHVAVEAGEGGRGALRSGSARPRWRTSGATASTGSSTSPTPPTSTTSASSTSFAGSSTCPPLHSLKFLALGRRQWWQEVGGGWWWKDQSLDIVGSGEMGRPNSQPDVLQDSIMSVQKMITEDDVKLKGIPLGCSQIMLWNLNIPRTQIRNRSKG